MHIYVCTYVCIRVYVFTHTKKVFTRNLSLKLFLLSCIQKKWPPKKYFMSKEWSVRLITVLVSLGKVDSNSGIVTPMALTGSVSTCEKKSKKKGGSLSPKPKPACTLLLLSFPWIYKTSGRNTGRTGSRMEKSPFWGSRFVYFCHLMRSHQLLR